MPRRTSRRAFGRWTPPSSGPTRIFSPIESLATTHLPIQGDYLLLRPTRLSRHRGRPKTRHDCGAQPPDRRRRAGRLEPEVRPGTLSATSSRECSALLTAAEFGKTAATSGSSTTTLEFDPEVAAVLSNSTAVHKKIRKGHVLT